MVVVPVPADALQPGAVVVLADATAGAVQMGGRRRVQITLPEEGEVVLSPPQPLLQDLPPMPPTHLARSGAFLEIPLIMFSLPSLACALPAACVPFTKGWLDMQIR